MQRLETERDVLLQYGQSEQDEQGERDERDEQGVVIFRPSSLQLFMLVRCRGFFA